MCSLHSRIWPRHMHSPFVFRFIYNIQRCHSYHSIIISQRQQYQHRHCIVWLRRTLITIILIYLPYATPSTCHHYVCCEVTIKCTMTSPSYVLWCHHLMYCDVALMGNMTSPYPLIGTRCFLLRWLHCSVVLGCLQPGTPLIFSLVSPMNIGLGLTCGLVLWVGFWLEFG